mmetsp:Transcript_17420/g.31407  ORF Transcript_17420/g.31407 Transcript_17420/m.31407 type:complete len:306 (+) Transcript_17420:598-1515(+)
MSVAGLMMSATESASRPCANDGKCGKRLAMITESTKPRPKEFATKTAINEDAHSGMRISAKPVNSNTTMTCAKERILPAQKALAPTIAARASNSNGSSQNCASHSGCVSLANHLPKRAPMTKVGTIAPTGRGNANTTAAVENLVTKAMANSTASSAVSSTPSLVETSLLSSSAGDSSLKSGCTHKSKEFVSATTASKSTTRITLVLLAACSATSSTFIEKVCMTTGSSPCILPSFPPATGVRGIQDASIDGGPSRARSSEAKRAIAGALTTPAGSEQLHRTNLTSTEWHLMKAAPKIPQSSPKSM